MSLRKKTLFMVGSTLIALTIILYIISQSILLRSFTELEERNAYQNTQRVLNALAADLEDLASLNYDWAAWDDTYNFIQDSNDEYIDSNIVDSTYINSQLNLLVFVDMKETIVFSEAFDLEQGEAIAVPQALREHLSTDGLLKLPDTTSNISGLLALPEGVLLITAQPIITSELEGPIRGTLIMGRYLASQVIQTLAERTALTLSAHRLDEPLSPDLEVATANLSADNAQVIQPKDEQALAGYALVNDIYGDPIMMFEVTMPRDIYQQGQQTLGYLVIAITVVGLTFGMVTLLTLEKTVLARLAQLTDNVLTIGYSKNRSARVPALKGKDELNQLVQTINQTLDNLEQSEMQLDRSEALLKAVHHRVKNNLQVIHSLLGLQANRLDDEKVVRILENSRNRVRSMALVHEKLHDTDNPSRVDFGVYLQDLVKNFQDSILAAPGIHIGLKIKSEPIYVDIDQAVPAGLIANELVSNALEHAFPDAKTGDIQVELDKLANGTYILRVSDNGIGFPDDTNPLDAGSLGLKLVQSLTQQLNGTIQIQQEGGTTYTITYENEKS